MRCQTRRLRLIETAKRALGLIYKPGHQYKKAGVMLSDLASAESVQGSFFDAPDTAKAQARMVVIDQLNKRFGRDAMAFATSGTKQGWKLKSEFVSAGYTTSWEDLRVN